MKMLARTESLVSNPALPATVCHAKGHPARNRLKAHRWVDDVAIVERVGRESSQAAVDPTAIAYVTLVRTPKREQLADLQRQLQELAGASITAVVLVSALPLNVQGDVDAELLERLHVIDESVRVNAERALDAEFAGCAALFLDWAVPTETSLLHLHDVMPVATSEVSLPPPPQVEASPMTPRSPRGMAHCEAPPVGGSQVASTLAAMLEDSTARFSEARILHVSDTGHERCQSLQELVDRARSVMTGLRAAELHPGDFVVFQLSESLDVLAAFWGCVFAGCIPVIAAIPPSHSLPTNERDKLCAVLELLAPRGIITDAPRLAGVRELCSQLTFRSSQTLSIDDLRSTLAAGERHIAEPEDVALLSLSSGSTGIPKAIQLTHKNLLARARGTNQLAGHRASDVILNWLPFDHIGSISDWHVRCVALGCTMVYCSKSRVLGEPLAWLRMIERYQVTHSWAPNFAYGLLNVAIRGAGEEAWNLSSVRTLLTAGEAVSSSTVSEFLSLLSVHGLAPTALRPAFGMAETGSGITYFQPTDERPTFSLTVDRASLTGALETVAGDHPRAISFTSLGPVIPGMAMRIVNEAHAGLPEATIGQLHVRGSAVSCGYYKNDEANRVFLNDGWLDTGDQGFIYDGELFLTGRSKDCIIINGANYFPIEIEKAVEEVAGVEVSFTGAYTVRPAGATRECLAVFFVPTADLPSRTLLIAVGERIAKQVGVRADYVVPLEKHEVPKTQIGKIQRKLLATQFEQGLFTERVRAVDLLLANERTLPNWFAVPAWRRCELVPGQVLAPRASVVLTASACELWATDGVKVLHVVSEDAAPSAPRSRRVGIPVHVDTGDAAALAEALRAFSSECAGAFDVIDVRALGQPLAAWDAKAEGTLQHRSEQLFALLAALDTLRVTDVRLWVASAGGQSLTADDRLCPAQGLLPPLVAAAAEGAAYLSASSVDFPAGTSLATGLTLLLAETAALPSVQAVAYRGGQRYVEQLRPGLSAAASESAPGPTDLALLTGGLGGIGIELGRRLLSSGVNVLFVGRRTLPEGVAGQCFTPRERGSMLYRAVDVEDGGALERAVAEAEAYFGRKLSLVFHLAGVAREKPVAQETWAGLRSALAGKALGAFAVAALQERRPSAKVVYFSSVTSRFADMATGSYAAANRLVEQLATRQRANGYPSYAVSWSAWEGVGMSVRGVSETALQARGLMPIGRRPGLESLWCVLTRSAANVLIGVDTNAVPIRSRLGLPPANLLRLRGYRQVDEHNAIAPVDERYTVQDGRGAALVVALEPMVALPRTPEGAVDYLALIGQGATKQPVAPRSETEQTLLELFRESLGLESLGVTDSFFELGGTSLAALTLVGAIEARFGQKLPASVLYEATTVEALAKLVQGEQPFAHDTLLPLTRGEASGPALFLVHDVDGETVMYGALAERLAGVLSVYALRSPRDTNGVHPTRIQDMAKAHVERVRRHQPHGPYYLGGLCAGGVIAFEMACQLREAGERVEFVALFDAADVQARRRSVNGERKQRLLEVLRAQQASIYERVTVVLNKMARGLCYETGRRGKEAIDRGRFLVVRYLNDGGRSVPPALGELTPRVIYHFAMQDYAPKFFDGRLILLRATCAKPQTNPEIDDTPAVVLYDDPLLGWGNRAHQVNAVDVSGGHSSMLQAPHVDGLAAAMRGHLLPGSASAAA